MVEPPKFFGLLSDAGAESVIPGRAAVSTRPVGKIDLLLPHAVASKLAPAGLTNSLTAIEFFSPPRMGPLGVRQLLSLCSCQWQRISTSYQPSPLTTQVPLRLCLSQGYLPGCFRRSGSRAEFRSLETLRTWTLLSTGHREISGLYEECPGRL